ncbi:MAG: MltA domain-containing protein [Gammaproteobacteria bacterium]|uniref:murein transglycosylase A n=1 Tax=Rhodoferax sp. TaxID=50421 RepID=UPI00180D3937|nr:MltA domain-containing protein [Rhodoferax sp.]MBU3900296.1 MltA domain-containing protein [Gammaproteobacteria bacterium]MBA3057176.1 transglycosylase [Rhodoferax sp.]MBU3997918.1 MltA domain-containing protein [Gammaproteobacteria bacterium]MBU4079366.1 MltA domain-containing protein [Gammaproteobacteria bacterium]MBU4111772.1 MltA domain-containing protein [Gammaproteobacteria bacterium]
MVHQTISTSSSKAPNASSTSKLMNRILFSVLNGCIVGMLVACSSAPIRHQTPATPTELAAPLLSTPTDDADPLPAAIERAKSRWTAVSWAELPGFEDDPLFEAWNAWIKSCERPGPVFAPLCSDVRRLSIGDEPQRRAWMRERLQPYRVDTLTGASEGLLTAYFEPVLDAARRSSAEFSVPLYQPPLGLAQNLPWYTRQQIDSSAQVQATLKGREIVFLADPVDALMLQIQGSGRVRISQSDGSQTLVRLAYAGSNGQPYKSVGRWLLDQGAVRDASWPAIKAWLAQNPGRVNELLWSNPRTVFFREEAMSALDAAWGPKGAQGVPLTPGRSIAVDPGSIPYGTPVWLASRGPNLNLQKLVLAQDTGSAIVGGVRADYFVGWGNAAAEVAGRLKQPLRLWVLWPK